MADLRFFADPDPSGSAPQFVDYAAQAIKPQALAAQVAPMEAANGDGVPQVGPPLIPMTIEQQKMDNKSAAVQYGGARPNQGQANGISGLIVAGVFVGGVLLYLRNK
jgi:hypothetical protein